MQPYGLTERRRRETRLALIGVVIGLVLVLILGTGLWFALRAHHQPATGSALPTNGAGPTTAARPTGPASPTTPTTCLWFPASTADNPNLRDVGIPPARTLVPGPHTMLITTNRGAIQVALDPGTTPCTVASFAYLAGRHFFDNTSCHRLVTTGLHVLQCGDPSGTGSGGPAYTFPDENLSGIATSPDGSITYRRGVVAMANSGANTNGSQFFIVYQDSPLPPNYTEFGTVVNGMPTLETIAAAGDDGAFGQAGGGPPKLSVVIQSLKVS